MVRQQRAQTLEAGVDALHAAPLVAVGDLPPDALLLLHGAVVAHRRGVRPLQAATTPRPSALTTQRHATIVKTCVQQGRAEFI